MAGLTATGFEEKTLNTINTELADAEKAAFGAGINVLATSVFGQLNGVMAGQFRELWELASAVYRAMYPDSSSDDALDNVAAITGALRLPATETTVDVHCTGTPATALSIGRVVTTGIDDRFESTAAATIAAATAWAQPVAYVLNAIVTNSSNIYICTLAGTSAGGGAPIDKDDNKDYGDGLKWTFVGEGTGYAVVPFEAEETGPVACDAGAIDTDDAVGAIETPVAGWDDARNLTDATAGRDLQTDAAFRLRREQLLAIAGAATVDAIVADLLAVTGVVEAHVFENITLVTDGDGVPGKAFESVVRPNIVDAETAASVLTDNFEPFALADVETLLVKVDGAGAATVTFNAGAPRFVDITNATAAEVAGEINGEPLAGAVARAVTISGRKYVEIKSDTTGVASILEITGGTGNAALGFPSTPIIVNGIDVKLAQTIWETKAGGIEPHGEFKIAVEDTQGDEHLVGLSNPTEIPIYIDVTLTTDDDYPSDGDTQVKAALSAFIDALGVGSDVIFERLQAEVFTISGVADITAFELDTVTPPVGVVNIAITNRRIATSDTTHIRIPNP